MNSLLGKAIDHTSGCSYEMVALYVKGKKRILGRNRLTSPAHIKHKIYPPIAGVHAELSIFVQSAVKLKGGTIYVTGVRSSRSKNRMLTTKPCKYCMHVITHEMNINAIVYWYDGIMVKEIL